MGRSVIRLCVVCLYGVGRGAVRDGLCRRETEEGVPVTDTRTSSTWGGDPPGTRTSYYIILQHHGERTRTGVLETLSGVRGTTGLRTSRKFLL